MTKITLRVYIREIETMVESGQFDEAIAHCRQILKNFPMHLDTYRLLGKAFLEARKYPFASDIFQRVILSVPDDFVSHVGMSIIRDDEGKLDQATWHMERAFEIQPSNPAIQDELRKLYGRRDGVEPSKVRLTRDALANMYTQGALYSQAIAEIRSVLANDPNRPDLQVMLVRAYSRDGRKSQAIELCTGLLRKYPYCFDALRTLLDVMTSTDRLDIFQSYRQRVFALDPYAAFATGSVFDSNKVPDAAVSLDHLNTISQKDEAETLPAWSSSLGIKLESDPNRSSLPDNFTEEINQGKPEIDDIPTQEFVNSEEIILGSEEIPDWIRSSGWEPTTGTTTENTEDEDHLHDLDEQLEKAEIPAWLNEMAPAEDTLVGDQQMETTELELNKQIEVGTTGNPLELDETGIGEDPFSTGEVHGDVPEWLQEMRKVESNLEEGTIFSQTSDGTQEQNNNLLSEEMQAGLTKEKDQPEIDIDSSKDNLQEVGNLVPDLESTLNEFRPDWLTEPEPDFLRDRDTPANSSTPEEIGSEVISYETIAFDGQEAEPQEAIPAEDLPDWINEINLSSETNSGLDLSSPEPKDDVETSPDGITGSDASVHTSETEGGLSKNPQLDQGKDEFFQEKNLDGSSLPTLEEQNAVFSWLEGLAARQGAKPEELINEPGERIEEPPEWVKGILDGKVTPIQHPDSIRDYDRKKKEESISLGENIPGAVEISEEKDEMENNFVSQELIADQEPVKTDTLEESIKQARGASEEEYSSPESQLDDFEKEKVQNITSPLRVEAEPEKEVSDWLKEMEEREGITDQSSKIVGSDLVSRNRDSGSLPDWLKEVEKEAEASEWIQGMENQIDGEKEAGIYENLPEEQIVDEENEVISPRIIESFTSSENDNEPPVVDFGKSATSNEWKPLEEVEIKIPSNPDLSTRVELMASGKLPGTGILSKIPGINVEKESATLEKAQNFIEKDDLKQALLEYGRLIKKGQMLEQVIHDLREITYRYPIEISIWQMLGDAFMRANRLQDALDAYTKAEELLR